MAVDIITWNRLEPRPSSDDQTNAVAAGLEARIYDPMWLLGRQWQFRELEGQDTGSPVNVRLQYATTQLTRWQPRGTSAAQPQPFNPQQQPLAPLVEREAKPFVGLRASAQAGLHFLSMLNAAGKGALRSAYLQAYPLNAPAGAGQLDPAADQLTLLLSGRAPDAVRLAADLVSSFEQQPPALPAIPPIAASDHDAVLAVARAWLSWYAAEIAPASVTDCWVPDRLEYRFAVAAPATQGQGEIVLGAPDYRGDGLDWFDFVHEPETSLGAAEGASVTQTWVGLPAPVTFRGMPAMRWWEFEDAAVDLGAVDTAPDDLGRLLVTEFATVFGNDWYQIPVSLPRGSMTSIISLVVTDSFGERRLIEPTAKARNEGGPWRMFHISEASAARGAGTELEALFLPPVMPTPLEGQPLEELLFLRDEMADMAWAIERVVQGASGGRVDRSEEWQRSLAAAAAAAPALATPIAPLRYLLATTVPDHWIPLIAVHDGRGVRLQRGAMLHFEGGATVAIEPRGQLLASGTQPLRFYEEEVPRDGRRVQRFAALGRWYGGESVGWISRRSRVGRGEGSSGLRYDLALPTDRP